MNISTWTWNHTDRQREAKSQQQQSYRYESYSPSSPYEPSDDGAEYYRPTTVTANTTPPYTMSQAPTRQGTTMTMATEEAVPDIDPSATADLLAERLQAWKHAVGYLEEYMEAMEKLHKTQSKEYERVLKTVSNPLREGHHFDKNVGGVNGFFENIRTNTTALIDTNQKTGDSIKTDILPILDKLHKEIKSKAKDLASGASKGAKELEKARANTNEQLVLLSHNTASFDSTGGHVAPSHDPYVVQRGVMHRLTHQVHEENNYREDLIAIQGNFQQFEAHVIQTIQQAMDTFNSHAGGQAEKTRALFADMTGKAQAMPHDSEWKAFFGRSQDILIDPQEPPRVLEAIFYPNQDHPSTKAVIEGVLERKSRNKLSWGTSKSYYVVTQSKYLHEFPNSDDTGKEPVPELSIYLPEATLGLPKGEKFEVKGKDKSKTMSSVFTGSSELNFKAKSPEEAQKWFEVLKTASEGAPVHSTPASPIFPSSPVAAVATGSPAASLGALVTPVQSKGEEEHKPQEAGVTGGTAAAAPALVAAKTAVAGSEKAPVPVAEKATEAVAAPAPTTAAEPVKPEPSKATTPTSDEKKPAA